MIFAVFFKILFFDTKKTEISSLQIEKNVL